MVHFLELDDLLETHAFQIATYGGLTTGRNLRFLALAPHEAVRRIPLRNRERQAFLPNSL